MDEEKNSKNPKYKRASYYRTQKKKDDYKQRRMKARRQSKPKKIRKNVNKQGKERKKTSYIVYTFGK